MNLEELQITNQQLLQKIGLLENELEQTKDKLKKYTAPSRHKSFYNNHKEEILQKNKDYYNEKVTPEKRKQYARTAYLNKKEKQKQQNENI